MSNDNGGMSCTLGSWALAAGVGLLAFILLMVLGDWRFIQALFAGAVLFVVLGLLFSFLFCRSLPAPGEASGVNSGSSAAAGAVGATAAAGAAAAAGTSASASASDADAAAADAGDASGSAAAAADTAASSADTAAEVSVQPSARLAGEEDLASRKGTWKYEGEQQDAAPAKEAKAKKPAKAAKAKADKPAKAAKADKPKKAAKAAKAAAPAVDAGDDTVDRDGDGIIEGRNEGSKPTTLDGPRDGGADNLKEIKGIGPKLEKLCNKLGFYHFDQIANWTADEVAWVDANLEGFRGRVTRDKWVEQAKILAAGGETEFSKRVEGGNVY